MLTSAKILSSQSSCGIWALIRTKAQTAKQRGEKRMTGTVLLNPSDSAIFPSAKILCQDYQTLDA
jgi:hypothetical protein